MVFGYFRFAGKSKISQELTLQGKWFESRESGKIKGPRRGHRYLKNRNVSYRSLFYIKTSRLPDIVGRTTHHHPELTWLQYKLHVAVIQFQFIAGNGKGKCFGFTGL